MQVIRVTVKREGPTHIVTFDDKETSDDDGDVLHSLINLREEARQVDMSLHQYQDRKGILIDIPLHKGTNGHEASFGIGGSHEGWANAHSGPNVSLALIPPSPRISRHQVSMEHASQSAEKVLHNESATSGRRWFHQITRASALAVPKPSIVMRRRRSTMELHAVSATLSIAAAALGESKNMSHHSSDDSKSTAAAPSIWSQRVGADTGAASSAGDLVDWLQALPEQDIGTSNCQVEYQGVCSSMSPKRVNFRQTQPHLSGSTDGKQSKTDSSNTTASEINRLETHDVTWRCVQSHAHSMSVGPPVMCVRRVFDINAVYSKCQSQCTFTPLFRVPSCLHWK